MPKPKRKNTSRLTYALASLPLTFSCAMAAEPPKAPPPSTAELIEQIAAMKKTIERQQQQIDALVSHVEASQTQAAPAPSNSTTTTLTSGDATAAPTSGSVPVAHRSASASGDEFGKVKWSGYGVINYASQDFYANTQTSTPERRATSDLERIVLAPTFSLGKGYKFVTEIEFEHGGTGSTIEYEPEEAGEFEAEIEKGGEIVLEQAHLVIEQAPWLNWRVGEVLVPFGMINMYHQPSQYFTIERPTSETNFYPTVWHETGVGLFGSYGQLRYEAQVITGLDSSGFSGYGFVSHGMQNKLEYRNADALALVVQADYSFLPGALVGGSVYFGDTAANRARNDMTETANLFMANIYGRYERGPVIVRGQFTHAQLENSDLVTKANLRSFNATELGISKTPVGSEAYSFMVEAGYDVFSLFDVKQWGRLDTFARYEEYNTHAATEGTITAIPRYERTAATFGLNYKPRPGVVLKAEYSNRSHSGTTANKQDYYGLGVGVEF
ncbi:MAG: hypothetical protein PHI49_02870 [Halothiobacillaceae bacterium]|nr:hypothetical protein [Halothiobacillaceae bacterium]